MAKKKTAKKPTASSLSAELEKTIEKDFQVCEELLRAGAGRNEWVEKNCKRMKSWQEAAEAGDARGQLLYGLCFYYGHGTATDDRKRSSGSRNLLSRGMLSGSIALGFVLALVAA